MIYSKEQIKWYPDHIQGKEEVIFPISYLQTSYYKGYSPGYSRLYASVLKRIDPMVDMPVPAGIT